MTAIPHDRLKRRVFPSRFYADFAAPFGLEDNLLNLKVPSSLTFNLFCQKTVYLNECEHTPTTSQVW